MTSIFAFLVFFIYSYKNWGKLRQSVIGSFATATFYLSFLPPAHSGTKAEAFTSSNQIRRNYALNGNKISNNSNNGSSGAGKPDNNGSDDNDFGMATCPNPESPEETAERLFKIDKQTKEFEELTDSDSETEEGQCGPENKGNYEGLPNGNGNFLYDLDQNKRLKKEGKNIWKKNHVDKERVVKMLKQFGDKAYIEEKAISGLKKVTDLKAFLAVRESLSTEGKIHHLELLVFGCEKT